MPRLPSAIFARHGAAARECQIAEEKKSEAIVIAALPRYSISLADCRLAAS